METGSDDTEKRLENAAKELADCQLQLQQIESRNRAMQQTLESQDKQKRQLEDDVDQLNAKLAKLSKSGGGSTEAEAHQQKVVAQLRDQIALKNSQIKKLTVPFTLITYTRYGCKT